MLYVSKLLGYIIMYGTIYNSSLQHSESASQELQDYSYKHEKDKQL
jgi:hypothetical protein